jgi:hypothetical protein
MVSSYRPSSGNKTHYLKHKYVCIEMLQKGRGKWLEAGMHVKIPQLFSFELS